MTMICEAKSKAELKAKLDAGCPIIEPTPFGEQRHNSKNTMLFASREPVCLDPQTRRRFATIRKLVDGTWEVK